MREELPRENSKNSNFLIWEGLFGIPQIPKAAQEFFVFDQNLINQGVNY